MSENILKRIVLRRHNDVTPEISETPVNEETVSEQEPPQQEPEPQPKLPPFVAVLLKQFGITPEAIQAYAENFRVAVVGALQRIEDRCDSIERRIDDRNSTIDKRIVDRYNTIDKRLQSLERVAQQTEMTDGAVRDVDLKEGQFMG